MNQKFATSLYAEELLDVIPFSKLQKQYLNYLETDEVDCQMQITTTMPKNVLDYNATIYFTYQGNLEYTFPLNLCGDYQQYNTYAGMIIQQLNNDIQHIIPAPHEVFTVDDQICQFQYKLVIGINTTARIDGFYITDVKLAHVMGISYEDTVNKTIHLFDSTPVIPNVLPTVINYAQFDNKMYINMFRQLNIYCSQMSVPGLTSTDQNMFQVAKLPYMFQPGGLTQISANFPISFMTANLGNGIQIDLQNEYGQQIDLEGSYYIVDLQCQPSQNQQIRLQLQSEMAQMHIQQQKQMQQQIVPQRLPDDDINKWSGQVIDQGKKYLEQLYEYIVQNENIDQRYKMLKDHINDLQREEMKQLQQVTQDKDKITQFAQMQQLRDQQFLQKYQDNRVLQHNEETAEGTVGVQQ